MGNERKFPRQLGLLGLMILAVVALVLALPVADNTRNQILTLIGLIVSGMFAFSSTTIMANLMAGVMLRMTRPFSHRGFYSSGNIVWARCRAWAAGYRDPKRKPGAHCRSEHLLDHPCRLGGSQFRNHRLDDAIVGLRCPSFGGRASVASSGASKRFGRAVCPYSGARQFSITYRVNGLLRDAKSLLTVQSNLCREILDVLHDRGIEIASPTIMNQRPLAEESKLIPTPVRTHMATQPTSAEEIVFDKGRGSGAVGAGEKEIAEGDRAAGGSPKRSSPRKPGSTPPGDQGKPLSFTGPDGEWKRELVRLTDAETASAIAQNVKLRPSLGPATLE